MRMTMVGWVKRAEVLAKTMRRRLVRLAVVVGALVVMAMPMPAAAGTCYTTSFCWTAGCAWQGAEYEIEVCHNDGQVTSGSSFVGCGC